MPKRRAPARAANRNNQTSPSSPVNGTSSVPDMRRATEQANALAPLFSSRGGFSLSDAETILPGGDGSDENLKRAVEAGFVEVLRAFFAVSASMLSSADIVAAMPQYMRVKFDQAAMVIGGIASRAPELVPSGVPWAINATTQIRRAGLEFVRGLQSVPSIRFSHYNDFVNETTLASGIYLASLVAAKGLPGPEMSSETAEEGLRLLTAVWRPTDMMGRDALNDEKKYRKACSAFRRCMEVLSVDGFVHLPTITGVHWQGFAQRFVRDLKRPGISFLSRISTLMLLCEMYRWNHGLQEENGGLLFALSHEKVIASLSDFLIEYKNNRQSNEISQLDSKSIDEVTLELPTFWCTMMLGAELMEIDDLGVQTVQTELLTTVDIWRLESSVDRSKLMQKATTSLFVALAAHGDPSLYVKPAVQLIDARQRMEALPGANPSIIKGMIEYEQELAEGFDEVQRLQVNNRSSTSERARTCAAKDCERGWDPQGGPLKACSRCRLVEYCSPTCQRAHWPAHKAACKASK